MYMPPKKYLVTCDMLYTSIPGKLDWLAAICRHFVYYEQTVTEHIELNNKIHVSKYESQVMNMLP